MALEASFSVVQLGTSTLVFTDDSTGADATVSERRIYLQQYDQTYLVPDGTTTDYIVWDIDDATITLVGILDRDYALDITVIWVAANPDPDGTYEYEQLTEFDAYTMTFLQGILAQKAARYPTIVNDNKFNLNVFKLYTYVLDARNAITVIQNIYLSQAALDLAYYMMQNTNNFF